MNKKVIDDVPELLSVVEVAHITGLSAQMVRRHCKSGKFQGVQPSGLNGIWYVKSDTFKKNPEYNWDAFMSKRNELYERSKEVAETYLKLVEEESGNTNID